MLNLDCLEPGMFRVRNSFLESRHMFPNRHKVYASGNPDPNLNSGGCRSLFLWHVKRRGTLDLRRQGRSDGGWACDRHLDHEHDRGKGGGGGGDRHGNMR